ncbi:MAG: O-antigen ligase family protein [Mariprofundaceae bacterium]|nr:O-antigen ligase family protein [Mariprofundaceae bacterium]
MTNTILEWKNNRLYQFLLLMPIIFMPLMVNVRIFPFVAPNEEPKWMLFTLCVLIVATLASSFLWKNKQQIHIPITISSALITLFYLLLAISIWISPNQVEGIIRFSFWVSTLIVFLIAAYAVQRHSQWLETLIWVSMLGLFVFCLRYWYGYMVDYSNPGYNISVLFSPIGHINFTGDVLIMLIPFTAWVLATHQNLAIRLLAWFSLTTFFTMLLVAASRGALGGVVLGFLFALLISLPHLLKLKWQNKHFISAGLLLSTLLISWLTFQNLDYKFRDLARMSASSVDTIKGIEGLKLTPNVEQPPLLGFWMMVTPYIHFDRSSMYASSTAMAFDAPWLGQGTGSFPFVYPNFSNRFTDFRDPLSSDRTFTTNPHNMLLQVSTQNGIPAMLIFIGLLSFFWFRLAKTGWQKADPLIIAGSMAISAVIFDAMFNHVFFNPASLFVFALLGGLWWGRLQTHEQKKTETKQLSFRGHRVFAGGILVAALLLSVWPTRWVLSEWHVGQAMHQRDLVQMSSHYQKAYDLDPYNFRAVFGIGQTYYRKKDFPQATKYMAWFKEIYPYNTAGLNMLGALYLLQGQLDPAEKALKEALRVYPGYQMAIQNLARVQQLRAAQKRQVLPILTPR